MLNVQVPHVLLDHIYIVMVNTTLPANIGAAARAMKTMGLSKLVLVAPKTYPSDDATALAAGASDVLDQAIVVATLEDAIADCELVFGTSARSRTIPWPLLEVRAATGIAIEQTAQHQHKIAIVFGREDRGLTNEELALANYHLTIPVNQDYGVLNVAAAIQLVCYELRMHALAHCINNEKNQTDANAAPQMPLNNTLSMDWDEPLVTHAQMQQFYPHMESMLADIDFIDPKNPRLLPLRIKRLFGRIQLDRVEYNLLRGIFGRVQALARGQWPPETLRKKDKMTHQNAEQRQPNSPLNNTDNSDAVESQQDNQPHV